MTDRFCARHTTGRAVAFLAAALLPALSPAASVLMVSIDGLRPDYVLGAGEHGLKVPYLRSMCEQGSFATGVTGVWPTVTYPSHTTLVTGAWPAEHGIASNEQFDPHHRFEGAWYWYASSVRVPTLWQAAQAGGLSTASVGWPVTVGASGIDYLIPEYWRLSGPTEELNPLERSLIDALTQPPRLVSSLAERAGEYMQGNDTTPNGDRIKTRYAIELLRQHHPQFMTLHLSSLDDAEHDHGVFSPQADANLETIDGLLAELSVAAHAADPQGTVLVVSDHGFTNVQREVNLYVAFAQAGLLTVQPDPDTGTPRISTWRAQPWLADGMAAIVLRDANDADAREATRRLLARLAADPRNGIDGIRTRADMEALGAFPGAEFLVVFKSGVYAAEHLTGALRSGVRLLRGEHGFSPELPEMRASFFAVGPGIAAHRGLGVVDMRQIAPTVAQLLGVALPTAHAQPLPVAP